MIVMPIGSGLLYAEPIYLQAERSPMPELRLVVLALQDRLAYGPTFEAAMAALFSNAPSTISTAPGEARAPTSQPPAAAAGPKGPALQQPATDVDALIRDAAKDLADYQRLTAEGRLADAGAKLEALKQKLERAQRK
jgi:hypothetical protein